MNNAGSLNLFFAEITIFIAGKGFRENQQTVQRTSQFMAHIGQEFRLIFACQFDSLGFFLYLVLCPMEIGSLLFQSF